MNADKTQIHTDFFNYPCSHRTCRWVQVSTLKSVFICVPVLPSLNLPFFN